MKTKQEIKDMIEELKREREDATTQLDGEMIRWLDERIIALEWVLTKKGKK